MSGGWCLRCGAPARMGSDPNRARLKAFGQLKRPAYRLGSDPIRAVVEELSVPLPLRGASFWHGRRGVVSSSAGHCCRAVVRAPLPVALPLRGVGSWLGAGVRPPVFALAGLCVSPAAPAPWDLLVLGWVRAAPPVALPLRAAGFWLGAGVRPPVFAAAGLCISPAAPAPAGPATTRWSKRRDAGALASPGIARTLSRLNRHLLEASRFHLPPAAPLAASPAAATWRNACSGWTHRRRG